MFSPEIPRTSAGTSRLTSADNLCDAETAITEMTFLPDGRMCLFGASREMLELLESLQLGDSSLNSRLAAMRAPSPASSVNDHD